ncbi:MAG: N-acetylglucosamine-6-phosphate deacetylase [Planctomycetaceae bacterium]|nr:N-acetylglucosamine-6-phosphate deacetylase [Planctomycetaceae bacterium]
MSDVAFVNGTVILPDQLIEAGQVSCRDGKIVHAGRSRRLPNSVTQIDAQGGFISPGYIDLHVHGGDGADFMDGTASAVATVCRAHARHGTTTIFPTSTTGSTEQINAFLSTCSVIKSQHRPGRPRIAGVHLYGPYFAENKVGCHSKEGRRNPTPAEYATYFDSKLIKIATCAAELPGAVEFYRMAKRKRCLVTCGHSNSSWDEMADAFKAGMRHVDHFWCAMSSVPSLRQRFGVPMRGSMAEFVLMQPEMSTEVIADGHHLAPELLEFAYRMKGPERLCLVTDCNRALDMPPGDYRFGCHDEGSQFTSDGKVGWAPDGNLASSVVGMDHMVKHMAKVTSASLPEVIRMASLTPARRTGIDKQVGSLEKGKQADVLVLNKRLDVKRVFIGGVEFHSNQTDS